MIEISVIIPSYNYADYITETLDSLLIQNHPSLEIIIIDDGSTDNTANVLKPYRDSNRITYIYQENKGLPAARNMGIKQARGKYLYFIDADDLVPEDSLFKLAELLENNPQADMAVGGNVRFKDICGKRQIIYKFIPQKNKLGNDAFKALINNSNFIAVGSCMIRRSSIAKIGLFSEEMKSVEDYEMWMRVAYYSQVVYLKDIVIKIRRHNVNMSGDLYLIKTLEWEIYGLNKIIKIVDKDRHSVYLKLIKNKILKKKIRLGLEYLRRNNISEGRNLFKEIMENKDGKKNYLASIYYYLPNITGFLVRIFKYIHKTR